MIAFNWQMKGWPKTTIDSAALRDELAAFGEAFERVKASLSTPPNENAVMNALVDEALTTSAIEGVDVDETVVMSSICRALGIKSAPPGAVRDARSEGVANMVLSVREDWDRPVSSGLIKSWHAALMANDPRGIIPGEFRKVPVYVVARNAFGESEIRFEAPPAERIAKYVSDFARKWARRPVSSDAVALKAALLHPHFESIHPFEDGNGRVGRALVAKTLAEGLGQSLVLPVSTIVARHLKGYYAAINDASRSLDWTDWAGFFIPVLTETLSDFVAAARFVAAKKSFLEKYEASFSDRARKVILRMLEDGEKGVAAGLSAAKWMRMTKVSKPTATRDLEELVKTGAIIREGESVATRYRLDFDIGAMSSAPNSAMTDTLSREPLFETINETINPVPGNGADAGANDGMKDVVLRLVRLHPGKGVPFFRASVKASRATITRAIAALVAAGKIEHRGSRKTGGYYATGESGR